MNINKTAMKLNFTIAAPDFRTVGASSMGEAVMKVRLSVARNAREGNQLNPLLTHLAWSNSPDAGSQPVLEITSRGATPAMLRSLANTLHFLADDMEHRVGEDKLNLREETPTHEQLWQTT